MVEPAVKLAVRDLRVSYGDEEVLSGTAQLVATPLWFLAVYMMVIPAAPAMLRLHDRYGAAVVIGFAAVAGGVDFLAREVTR